MIINIKNVKENKSQDEKNKLSKEEEILKTVQANGYIEIKQYEKMVTEFIKTVEGMAVFKKVFTDTLSEQVRFMLIDEILNSLIKPLFEGNMPALVDTESFNSMRRDMYENLLNKYIDNDKGDEPF